MRPAARMEQYHGNKPIPVMVGRALGRVANDAVADLERMEIRAWLSTCSGPTNSSSDSAATAMPTGAG
jgi:hypothetical protein